MIQYLPDKIYVPDCRLIISPNIYSPAVVLHTGVRGTWVVDSFIQTLRDNKSSHGLDTHTSDLPSTMKATYRTHVSDAQKQPSLRGMEDCARITQLLRLVPGVHILVFSSKICGSLDQGSYIRVQQPPDPASPVLQKASRGSFLISASSMLTTSTNSGRLSATGSQHLLISFWSTCNM